MATSIFVTIDSVAYDTYRTLAQANEYLNASITSQAVAWRAATDDTKRRALVEATRYLDTILWKGNKTDEDQELEWPRSNTGVDGLGTTEIPVGINKACMELAAMFISDSDLRSNLDQVDAKRLKAGSVEIEYFRGSTVQTRTALPKTIVPYVRALIAATRTAGLTAYGTSRQTDFDNDYGFSRGL